jgi:L-seryl-tRNA(Ser) seleniumtransferase
MGLYASLGVRTVINARGNATLVGGTLMDPEVLAAMAEAGRSFVRIADLEEAASAKIAAVTGAEAGYVTSGAAAGVTLATAAVLAGLDPERMDRLPETDGQPNEILIQRVHRNPYDHMVRAAGARLVEFGDERGGSAAEMAGRIGPATAGVFYHAQAERLGVPFDAFVEVAHASGLPVIVDASVNLPPRSNLRRYVEAGADLVAFSGGKTIRGPQASGILAGRRDLLISVGLQHQDMDVMAATWERRELLESGRLPGLPQHGIGRPMKAGKEEIAGLLVALDRYLARDEAAERRRWTDICAGLASGLATIPGLAARVEAESPEGRPVPATLVTVDPARFGRSAVELVRAMQDLDPIVMVGDHEAEQGILRLDPENLTTADVDPLVDVFRRGAG